MKKEEKGKFSNPTKEVKTQQHQRSRSFSPKAYLGCDTCKSKNVGFLRTNKSVCKTSDFNCSVSKIKFKSKSKKMADSEKENLRKGKVRLTDLCYEDKKRIVELIEELSKFAENNQKLNEMLDSMQKSRQEQQDYIMKQANLHLEEKNFYINEINEHKSKLESAEKDLKNKALVWEKQERDMNIEIAYLTKALKESANEKKDLSDQMNHLRNCLKQSLESFQQLKKEVCVLQHYDKPTKKFKSTFAQTERKSTTQDKNVGENVMNEFVSTCRQNSAEGKSSLEAINDKLEDVYKLLKKKSKICEKSVLARKFDIDLSIFSRNDKLTEILINNFQDESSNPIHETDETNETNSTETGYRLLGPFDQNSKMSVQAERILNKMERPLIFEDGYFGEHEKKKKIEILCKRNKKTDGCWPNTIVQQNAFYRSEDERQQYEDKLFEDLFYKVGNLKLDVMEFLQAKDDSNKTF